MSVKYTGSIYTEIGRFLQVQDGFSFGEKLTQIERHTNKKFIELTDEEILNTLLFLVKSDSYYEDTQLTNEEFYEWLDNK
jgi:hypothetical protein